MAAGHQSVRVSVCGITSPLPLATYLQAYSLYRLSQSRFSVACDRQPTIGSSGAVIRVFPSLSIRLFDLPYVRFNTRIDQDCVRTVDYGVCLTAANFRFKTRQLRGLNSLTSTPRIAIIHHLHPHPERTTRGA